MPTLNGLDYVLLLVVAFFTLSGLRRGLVRQIVDLVAWAGSIYLAFTFGNQLAAELNRLFGLDVHLNQALGPLWGNFAIGVSAVNVLGFVAVLIMTRIAAGIVANALDMVAKLPVIRSFNVLGGAALGFGKGVLIVFLVATVARALPAGAFSPHIEGSQVVEAVLSLSPHFYEQLREFILRARPLV